MRAFFAIDLPERERRLLAAAQERMRKAVRGVGPKWVEPSQLHVTLKFLGDIDRGVESELVGMATASAAEIPPLATRLETITTFGPPRRARVIVATLADPEGLFAALAARLEQAAVRVGVPAEGRQFVPHVTVARIQRPHDPSVYLAQAGLAPSEFVCHELTLYQSELRPAGPSYTVLHRARFEGKDLREPRQP
jgi:2'-5' RNA ligase